MKTGSNPFPTWPPGMWRRLVIQPGPGWIGGALEDDIHRFHMRFDHSEGRITRARAAALRHPWSACPGAAPHIAGELTGAMLGEVAARDPMLHCTHLYDLAVVLAAHAYDTDPTRIDLRVADRVNECTTAVLEQDGVEVLRWQLEGTVIQGEDRDLRRLSQWKQELSPRDAERATMLRRAIYISGGRQFDPPKGLTTLDMGPARQGVCFNYQPPQSARSTRTPDWITDFSRGASEPLAGFDAARELAVMSGE